MQPLLKALIQEGTCLTLDLLIKTTGRTHPETVRALRKAFEVGAVQRSEKGQCYQITDAGRKILTGVTPVPVVAPASVVRYQDTRQQRIWNAARSLKKFSSRDVTLYARYEEELVSDFIVSANQYIAILRRAGFLVRMDLCDKRGKRPICRFRLAKDTGPYAPCVRRGGKVFDRNTGVEVDIRPGDVNVTAAP